MLAIHHNAAAAVVDVVERFGVRKRRRFARRAARWRRVDNGGGQIFVLVIADEKFCASFGLLNVLIKRAASLPIERRVRIEIVEFDDAQKEAAYKRIVGPRVPCELLKVSLNIPKLGWTSLEHMIGIKFLEKEFVCMQSKFDRVRSLLHRRGVAFQCRATAICLS